MEFFLASAHILHFLLGCVVRHRDHKILQARKRIKKLEAKGELRKISSELLDLWHGRCVAAGVWSSDDASVQLDKFPAILDVMIEAEAYIAEIHEVHEKTNERSQLTNAIHESLKQVMDAALEPIIESRKQLEEMDRMVQESYKTDLQNRLRSRYTI